MKNAAENMGLFYFSQKLRASMGYNVVRCGCLHVALGTPVDILLGHVFKVILRGPLGEMYSKK
jgi:hypothetical protein